MKRFIQIGELKPDMVSEYKKLHAAVWPEVLETIKKCNLSNYSISIINNTVISYFEYNGVDYDSDMKIMESDPITLKWWQYTKPCFLHHDKSVYYLDTEEIFHFD